jgi:Xaa-Pro dipeptidase
VIPGERVCIDIIDDVRMVKSEYEIGRHVYACALATEVHNKLLADARPGTSLAEVAKTYSGMIMARLLADNPSINLSATRIAA